MTRVDFYLIEHGAAGEKELAVCKLANKAFGLGHRIYILTTDEAQARRLDQLLWTFSAGSFVPHALSGTDADCPVLIGHDEPPATCEDVLVTLATEVPGCFSRFRRVAEVVGSDEDQKRLARERFRFYRDRGYAPQSHTL